MAWSTWVLDGVEPEFLSRVGVSHVDRCGLSGFSDTSSLLLAQWAAGLPGAIHGSTVPGDDAQWSRTVDLLSGRAVAPLKAGVAALGRGWVHWS